MRTVWTAEQANAWYEKTPWQVGMNYVPSTAVNSTEMWQKESFDEATIRRELRMAHNYGFNSVRVFLQFIVWEHEREGFLDTFETFLRIAAENELSVMPILFDDCAFDRGTPPYLGKQLDPVPGLHNGRWTPSPGDQIAHDPEKQPVLCEYVKTIIGTYREDRRIIAWDLYNEPGNTQCEILSLSLLSAVFRWAWECDPIQPLTAGVWRNCTEKTAMNTAMYTLSDVISLHTYQSPEITKDYLSFAARYGKPIFVTEWLSRHAGNTVEAILPIFKEQKVSCWNWGFVVGRTQTNLWWRCFKNPDPNIWQHDFVYPDGTPYDPKESELIRSLRGI